VERSAFGIGTSFAGRIGHGCGHNIIAAAVIDGAKTMAMTAVDLWQRAEPLAAARDRFERSR